MTCECIIRRMWLENYFKRIGWSGAVSPTLDTLGKLIRAHNHSVPFENLDVQLGKKLTTDIQRAYDKIVSHKRGGWCYEQNGLFGWALTEIGFDVRRVAATVMRADRGSNSNANHLALLVSQPNHNSNWLVDVGFGGSLLHPIPLVEGSYEHPPFTLGLSKLDDGYWQFWEDRGYGKFSFDFENELADELAMSVRCDYLQTSPESGFVQKLVCQLRQPQSHITLRERTFSTLTKAGFRKRELASSDDFIATLGSEFGLNLPQAATLWERLCERQDAPHGSSDGG